MQTIEYLDEIKKKYDLRSDYALAKRLMITDSAVHTLRKGASIFSDETALKVAELLEINPAEVLIQCHMERSKNSEVKSAWEAISKMLAGNRLVRSIEENAPALPSPNVINAELKGQETHYYVK